MGPERNLAAGKFDKLAPSSLYLGAFCVASLVLGFAICQNTAKLILRAKSIMKLYLPLVFRLARSDYCDKQLRGKLFIEMFGLKASTGSKGSN